MNALDELAEYLRHMLEWEDANGEPLNCARWLSALERVRQIAAPVPAPPAGPACESLDAMVDRFLAWPLPKDFAPDCGIRFDGRKDDEWNKNKSWPVGTNLFTAEQARAMFQHAFAAPAAEPVAQQPLPSEIVMGDYVLATKWSDGDPGDAWAVGYYAGELRGRHFVVNANGYQIRANGFRRVGRIREDVGAWLLSVAAPCLEKCPPGTVNLWTMLTDAATKDKCHE